MIFFFSNMLLFSSQSAKDVLKRPDAGLQVKDYKQAEASFGGSICHIRGCRGQYTRGSVPRLVPTAQASPHQGGTVIKPN